MVNIAPSAPVISIWIYHLLLQCVVDLIKELCIIQRKMFTCVWHELKVYVILQCRWWDNSNPLCLLKQNKGLMPKNENGGNLKEMPMNERKKMGCTILKFIKFAMLLMIACWVWNLGECLLFSSDGINLRMIFTLKSLFFSFFVSLILQIRLWKDMFRVFYLWCKQFSVPCCVHAAPTSV